MGFPPLRRICILAWAIAIAASLAEVTSAQSTTTSLTRAVLDRYPLALCNDGSAAVYYHEREQKSSGAGVSGGKYMIYLPDTGVKEDCVNSRDCDDKCKRFPETCTAPEKAEKRMSDGIWSKDRRNNPFADYFKVYLPSCSSDEFSGTRGRSSTTGDLVFNGRHIFSSLLRDLVARFDVANAEDVVLIGSGSGARGPARNCDFLAESIATINPSTRVRCVLDGIDLVPYWVQSPNCFTAEHRLKAESQKDLWGRQDDKSCIEENADKVNSTELARLCGAFSKFWRHIDTPIFLTTTQLDPEHFRETTCGVSRTRNEDYSDFAIGWRQGMLVMAEAMSEEKPDNGWFIPNCDNLHFLLGTKNAAARRTVRVPLLQEGDEQVNAFQAINNWLTLGRQHQAIDPFGVPNDKCSATKSLPLDLRPDSFFEAVPTEPRNDAPRRKPPLPRPANAVAAAAARESAPLAATEPLNPFIQTTAFGRFHPPSELLAGGGQRRPDVFDFFDYDGLGLGLGIGGGGGGTNNDYDFDIAADPGIATGVAAHARAHPVDTRIGDRRHPTSVRVTAGSVPVLHPHHPRGGPVVHTRNKKIRLWRKLYYLDYLRKLYARHYNDYYHDYYGPGGNLVAFPDHPAAALSAARAGPVAAAGVHQLMWPPPPPPP